MFPYLRKAVEDNVKIFKRKAHSQRLFQYAVRVSNEIKMAVCGVQTERFQFIRI